MPRRERASASKGKAPEMDWEATDDPDCVAEEGWEDEEETPWSCTTCKRYVKMKHLMKLWPRSQAMISGPRREGLASSCESNHFLHRYHEVTIAVGVRNSRPEIMLYSNMAMVWAEIVLHKDVDWRTVAGLNVSLMDRSKHFIPTTWNQASDCWPRWSNRSSNDYLGGRHQQRSPPREYGSHNYNNYSNYGNDMNPAPVAFGGQGGGYYHYGDAQYDTRSNTPESYRPTQPQHSNESYRNSSRNEEEEYTQNYAPVSFGGHSNSTYGNYNTPPPTFRNRDDEDAEFQRQMREATLRSQEEYIRKLEDDSRYMERQYNNLYDYYSGGPYSSGAGPSRQRDSSSEED